MYGEMVWGTGAKILPNCSPHHPRQIRHPHTQPKHTRTHQTPNSHQPPSNSCYDPMTRNVRQQAGDDTKTEEGTLMCCS